MTTIRSFSRPTRRTITKLTAVATAAGSLFALSACASSGSTPSGQATGNAASGNISFWSGPSLVGGQDLNLLLIQGFEKKYPNIHVTYIKAPPNTGSSQATLAAQIVGGGGPDVYMGDVIWPAQFGAHQLAAPLSKYLPKSYWSTFANGLVAGATYQGQVYGAPFFEDEGFLYYRKDILKKDNLPVPATWEQLVSDSKVAQSRKQVQYGYVFQGADTESTTCDFVELLADAGGHVLNANGDKPTLNTQAASKAITLENSLVTGGISPKAESTYQETQGMTDFQNGSALFLRNWDYAYGVANAPGSKVAGDVGVAPMPTFAGQSSPGYSNIGGQNAYVNPHTKNLAADLTFVKFLTGTEAQTLLATKYSLIPSNEAVRTSPAITALSPVNAVAPQTKLIARPSQSPDYPAVSEAIYNAVNGMLAGQLTPQAALQQANSGIFLAIGNSGI